MPQKVFCLGLELFQAPGLKFPLGRRGASAIVSLGSIASTQNVHDDGAKKPGIAPIAFIGEC